MKESKFSQLRHAVAARARQLADINQAEKVGPEQVAKALESFRKIKEIGEAQSRKYVKAYADLWQTRLKMGEAPWNVLREVSIEKSRESTRQLMQKFEAKLRTGTIEDPAMEFRDLIFRTLVNTERAISEDPRVREAFKGHEKLFEKTVREVNEAALPLRDQVIDDIETAVGLRPKEE